MTAFPLTQPRPDPRHTKIRDAAHHLAAVQAEGPDDRLLTVRLYGHWVTSELHTNGTTRFHVFASLARGLRDYPYMYVRINPDDPDRVILSSTAPGIKVYFWDPQSAHSARFSCAPLTHHLDRLGYPKEEKHYYRAERIHNRLIIDTTRSYTKRDAIRYEKEHPCAVVSASTSHPAS